MYQLFYVGGEKKREFLFLNKLRHFGNINPLWAGGIVLFVDFRFIV